MTFKKTEKESFSGFLSSHFVIDDDVTSFPDFP